MFKIQMIFEGRLLDMPNDQDLRLSEACYRADIYKDRNPKRVFIVRNEDNDDIEYEI